MDRYRILAVFLKYDVKERSQKTKVNTSSTHFLTTSAHLAFLGHCEPLQVDVKEVQLVVGWVNSLPAQVLPQVDALHPWVHQVLATSASELCALTVGLTASGGMRFGFPVLTVDA